MTNRLFKALVLGTFLAGLAMGSVALAQSGLSLDSDQPAFDGWVQDEAFRQLGKQAYFSPDKGVILIVKDIKQTTQLSPIEWVEAYALKKLEGKTIKQKASAKLGPEHPHPGAWILTFALDDKKMLHVQAFAAFIRDDGSVKAGLIGWNNGNEANRQHTMTALQMLGQLSATSASSTTTAPATKTERATSTSSQSSDSILSLDGDDAADNSSAKDSTTSHPIVAPPGGGISPSEIHGVIYHWGESKTVTDRKTMLRIPTFPNQAAYLLLKNGWAYRNPDVPPSDLDQEASRRLQPKRWVQWQSNQALAGLDAMKPLDRGHTLDIEVSRPNTSVGYSTTRTTWKYLKLTRSGRFETSKYSISNSNYDGDAISGNFHRSATSSTKDGQFSSFSSQVSVGDGSITTINSKKNDAGPGSHTGHYFIDGNTIELRYDNGMLTRSMFGTDNKENVILGRTNYWAKKK